MEADLQAHLKAVPSGAEMITLKFRLVDAHGQPVRTTLFNSINAGMTDDAGTWTSTITMRPRTHPWATRGGIERIKEFLYPKAFDFPELKAVPVDQGRTKLPQQPTGFEHAAGHPDMDRFPVTPTTPTAFAKKTTGYAIDNIMVEPKAAFLVVQGRFVETLFEGFVDGAGEAFSPIMAPATAALGRPTTVMLTENQVKQPTFVTRETPFVVSALPGKAYRVRLNTKQPRWFLEVKAEPHQP